MAGVQFFLSRELPRTAEQISAILIITISNFEVREKTNKMQQLDVYF